MMRATGMVMAIAMTLLGLGCFDREPAAAPADDGPLVTVRALLALHDLTGRQPEDRPEKAKDAAVDRAKLAKLVADLDARDAFTTDLYLGFVLGALARNQTRLFVAREGGRAVVHAGQARIVLERVEDGWKVRLEESIPPEIKERAAQEKRSYDEAKARAGATR